MAFTSFVTDAQLKATLAAALHKSAGDLDPMWDQIVNESNAKAMGEINRRLLGQGYGAGQVAAFDSGGEFQRDIGLYWCIVKGGIVGQFDAHFVENLNRAAELSHIVVTNNGAIVTVQVLSEACGTGAYQSSADLFGQPIDPQDPLLGGPTQW